MAPLRVFPRLPTAILERALSAGNVLSLPDYSSPLTLAAASYGSCFPSLLLAAFSLVIV